MWRSLSTLAVFAFCGILLARADDDIIKAQTRLKTEGFYFGSPTGVLDRDTADALTRYQMSRGLTITGKLDAPTAKQLHVSVPNPASAPTPPPTPQVLAGSWQRLSTGEMQFVPEQTPPASTAEKKPAPAPPISDRPQPPSPAEGPATPLALDTSVSPAPTTGNRATPLVRMNPAWRFDKSPAGNIGNIENPERYRDYIDAFLAAGLARPPGSEIEFFADNVDYLGVPNVPRQQLQRDLVRYHDKWPHRRFWMDGDIQIEPQGGNQIKLTFPLRFELRNGARNASGRMMKSLTLLKTATNEMQIVAVSEWKAP